MKITPSKIVAAIGENGQKQYYWHGTSPMAALSYRYAEIFASDENAALVLLPGLKLRVVKENFSEKTYFDSVLVMRESVFALLMQKYFTVLPKIINGAMRLDRWLHNISGLKKLNTPPYILTRMLNSMHCRNTNSL